MPKIVVFERGFGKNKEFAFVDPDKPMACVIIDSQSTMPSYAEVPKERISDNNTDGKGIWRQIPKAQNFINNQDHNG